jgi:hypothetical protein
MWLFVWDSNRTTLEDKLKALLARNVKTAHMTVPNVIAATVLSYGSIVRTSQLLKCCNYSVDNMV